MVRERTGQPPSYTKAKTMRSLTLHTEGCHRASLGTALLFLYLISLFTKAIPNFLPLIIASFLFIFKYLFNITSNSCDETFSDTQQYLRTPVLTMNCTRPFVDKEDQFGEEHQTDKFIR